MSILLLRLLLTPTLVVLVSYIQKRWGHAIGGRVIGLPLSTAPFLILIYLMDGAEQAANAAHDRPAGAPVGVGQDTLRAGLAALEAVSKKIWNRR